MASQTNRIAELRKRAGLSQQALAEKVGSHWITISKLERGKMQLTGGWIERLAEALEVDMADLLPRQLKIRREVVIEGTIGPGGAVNPPDDGEGTAILLPADGDDDVVSYWLTCDKDALFPFFDEHDTIRFVNVHEEMFEVGLGRLCHVIAKDGQEFVGFLGQGADGEFNLSIPGRRTFGKFSIHNMGIAVEAKFAIPRLTTDIAD